MLNVSGTTNTSGKGLCCSFFFSFLSFYLLLPSFGIPSPRGWLLASPSHAHVPPTDDLIKRVCRQGRTNILAPTLWLKC
ncbi:hypothetical protein J3E69DRAFT_327812 [Trichoderma sp. SZMC 28015]